MTAAADSAEVKAGAQLASTSITAVFRFLSTIWPIDSVQKVAYSLEGPKFHLWVLLRTEVLEDAKRIYLRADELFQDVEILPIQLHVVPLSDIDEDNLPQIETIAER
jgi:hypothetical protein